MVLGVQAALEQVVLVDREAQGGLEAVLGQVVLGDPVAPADQVVREVRAI